MESKVSNLVRQTIANVVGVDLDKVAPAKSLEELGADSIDAIEIFMLIEDEFEIQLPDDGAGAVTVQDLIDLVERTQAMGAAV